MRTVAMLLLLGVCAPAVAGPVVFCGPDRTSPGDVVLLYGGNLAAARTVLVWRLPDGEPGLPAAGAADRPPAEAIRDRPRAGYLLLQNHGGHAEFRDVWLRDESGGR